jgi:hypothetical protein
LQAFTVRRWPIDGSVICARGDEKRLRVNLPGSDTRLFARRSKSTNQTGKRAWRFALAFF